jgi:speckle-type POZ protein
LLLIRLSSKLSFSVPWAEAAMPSTTLHEIPSATFRVMLRLIYKDAFPGDDELGESPNDMIRNLLAVVDRG